MFALPTITQRYACVNSNTLQAVTLLCLNPFNFSFLKVSLLLSCFPFSKSIQLFWKHPHGKKSHKACNTELHAQPNVCNQ